MYSWYRGKVLGRHGQRAGSSSGPGSGGSCCSTRVGDSGSHCALSQAPWVAWESSTALIYWIGGRKERILVTDFFFFYCNSYFRLLLGKDVLRFKAILPNKFLFGVQLVKMIETVYVQRACAWGWWFACLPELAAFIINCVVSHSDRTWFLDDCWYLSSWCQLF